MTTPHWRAEFVLASRERSAGRIPELVAAIKSGLLIRVSRGVYRYASAVDQDPVTAPDDAFLAVLRAAQLRERQPLVFAGMAAARIWDLPVVGSWPERALVSVAREAGGRSNAHLMRSYIGHPPPAVERGGLIATSLARTVADVARTETMERAVAVADAALRTVRGRSTTSKEAIAATLEHLNGAPGLIRAAGVLAFATGLSGSAGESCSRVGMRRLGFPVPVLQQEFTDGRGLIGYTDFTWPHLKLIGEFDGRGKYLRDVYTRGRSTADIVMAEKEREDRLRALGWTVIRWGWEIALSLPLLEQKLRSGGLTAR